MTLIYRLSAVVNIALAVSSGRMPTARAMALPPLEARQDTAVAASAVGTSIAATPSSVAATAVSTDLTSAPSVASSIISSIAPSSAAVTPLSAVASAAPATSSIAPSVSASSAAAAGVSATSTIVSVSGTLTSTSASSNPSATSLAEQLESPLPKPNYAPGGMFFIIPAFVVIGLIFIIWLIHKTKEYIWKLKEAEEAADTQSPDPAKGGGEFAAGVAIPKASKATERKTMGGKWKKKGWKELDSASEEEKYNRREARRQSDRYSRVGEWQGSRKYRSREREEDYGRRRERDESHRDGRGRYGRLEAHDEEHPERECDYERRDHRERRRDGHERRSSRNRPSSHDYSTHDYPDRPRSSRHDAPPSLPPLPTLQASAPASVPPAPQPQPSAPPSAPAQPLARGLSKKEKSDRAAEWIRGEKEYNDSRHHISERREIARDRAEEGQGKDKGKEKVPDAYEDEFKERYAAAQQFHLIQPVTSEGQVGGQGQEKLLVQMGRTEPLQPNRAGQAGEGGQAKTVAADQHVRMADSQPVQGQKPAEKTPASSTPQAQKQPEHVTKASGTPAHGDIPAYMRARAISPPPILSPPHHPTLFFHNGPSTTQLVPLSTYDSGTDLESMISGRPSPLSGSEEAEHEHGRMPSVPSTVGKLERSASADPSRTSKMATAGLTVRTPTRRKSHDPYTAPSTPSRTEALLTPTRRGTTDGHKTAGRTTPTIRLIESRGGSVRRSTAPGSATPDLSRTSGLTPKKYSKRLSAAPHTPSSTPESTRRVRAQRKELKARGKVDEILRESWSERAVVSPADGSVDDDEEEEVEEKPRRPDVIHTLEKVTKAPKDEVEVAHARRAVSPPPPPAPAAPATSPAKVRPAGSATAPLSPRKAAGQGTSMPRVESEDIRQTQGIEQRMALMKQLEERIKK